MLFYRVVYSFCQTESNYACYQFRANLGDIFMKKDQRGISLVLYNTPFAEEILNIINSKGKMDIEGKGMALQAHQSPGGQSHNLDKSRILCLVRLTRCQVYLRIQVKNQSLNLLDLKIFAPMV